MQQQTVLLSDVLMMDLQMTEQTITHSVFTTLKEDTDLLLLLLLSVSANTLYFEVAYDTVCSSIIHV